MLKTHRNAIGNLMITLLFVGGCIFLLTGSWDASESQASKSCCGGEMVATTTESCCVEKNNVPTSISDDDAQNATCDNCGYSATCPGGSCACSGSGVRPCTDKCKGNGNCKPQCTANSSGNACPTYGSCSGKKSGCNR